MCQLRQWVVIVDIVDPFLLPPEVGNSQPFTLGQRLMNEAVRSVNGFAGSMLNSKRPTRRSHNSGSVTAVQEAMLEDMRRYSKES